jgi:hypothetical protein
MFRAMQFRFSEFIQIPIALVNPPQNVEIYNSQREYLGRLQELMIKKWVDREIPREVGTHVVEIITNGYIGDSQVLYETTIHGIACIEKKIFYGPLPVDFVGLKDEHSGGVLTRSFTTSMIETSKLLNGKLDGWTEVSSLKEMAVQPFFIFATENCPTLESFKLGA